MEKKWWSWRRKDESAPPLDAYCPRCDAKREVDHITLEYARLHCGHIVLPPRKGKP